MSAVDFGRRSDDYAEHRPSFPASFYARLASIRAPAGLRALDVGTGTGTIALELARRGANVIGLDVSPNQVRAAGVRAFSDGLTGRARFAVGGAERLPVASAELDLATAGQCWHWFDQTRALAELRRVLRPGGLLVVASDAYLAPHDELAGASEELILRWNPSWTMAGGSGLHPEHIDDLIGGGFELVEQFCYDHWHPFTHAGWRGRMRSCNGIGAGALTDDEIESFDRALAELLRERFPAEPLAVRHRVWATVVRRP